MNTHTLHGSTHKARAHVMTAAHKRWLLREIRQRLAKQPGRVAVSERTRSDRVDAIALAYGDLWAIGYRIERVEALAPRHLTALLEHWKTKGLTRATVAMRWSHLATWCRTLGKAGIRPTLAVLWPAEDVKTPRRTPGTTLAQLPQATYQQLLDLLSRKDDPTVYWLARCVRELRLTREEAILFSPAAAFSPEEDRVIVWSGKNRGQRVVLLSTLDQVALVKQVVQRVADSGRGRLGWKNLPLAQSLRRYSNAIAYAVNNLANTPQDKTPHEAAC